MFAECYLIHVVSCVKMHSSRLSEMRSSRCVCRFPKPGLCVSTWAVVVLGLIASVRVPLFCVIRPDVGSISMYSETDMAVVTQRVPWRKWAGNMRREPDENAIHLARCCQSTLPLDCYLKGNTKRYLLQSLQCLNCGFFFLFFFFVYYRCVLAISTATCHNIKRTIIYVTWGH